MTREQKNLCTKNHRDYHLLEDDTYMKTRRFTGSEMDKIILWCRATYSPLNCYVTESENITFLMYCTGLILFSWRLRGNYYVNIIFFLCLYLNLRRKQTYYWSFQFREQEILKGHFMALCTKRSLNLNISIISK